MSEDITCFDCEYRYLSNFWLCKVVLDKVIYPSVENAYQAAKTLDLEERKKFEKCFPYEAKKFGRKVVMRPDWDDVKLDIMYDLVSQKFKNHYDVQTWLLRTGNANIIEGNYWKDTFWGVCGGVGENHLGKIIMRVRSEIRDSGI